MKSVLLSLSIFCSFSVLAQTPWISFRSHSGLISGFFKVEMTDNLGLPSNYSQRQFQNMTPIQLVDSATLAPTKTDSAEIKKEELRQKKMKPSTIKVKQKESEMKVLKIEKKEVKIKKLTSSTTKVLNHTTVNHQKDLKQNGFSIGVLVAGVIFLLLGIIIRKIKLVAK